jgi:hypothetical protein
MRLHLLHGLDANVYRLAEHAKQQGTRSWDIVFHRLSCYITLDFLNKDLEVAQEWAYGIEDHPAAESLSDILFICSEPAYIVHRS